MATEQNLLISPYGNDVRTHEPCGPNPTQQMVLDFVDKVRQSPEMDHIAVLLLIGGVGCIDGAQNVLMSDGTWKKISEVRVGDSVVTHKDGQYISAIVERHIDSGEKTCFEYIDSASQKIVCTPDHMFLCKNMYQDKKHRRDISDWRPISKLLVDNLISHMKPISIPEWDVMDVDITDDEIILLAYMLTDGSLGNDKQTAKFTNITIEYLEEFDRCFKRVFGIAPKWYKKGNGYDLVLSNGKRRKNVTRFGEVFKEKKYLFHHFSLRQLGLFFNRVVSADGSLYFKERILRNTPIAKVQIYPGIDKDLCEEFSKVLLRAGIVSHMYRRNRGGRDTWEIHINGRDALRKFFTLTGPIKGKEKKSVQIMSFVNSDNNISTRYSHSELGRITGISKGSHVGLRRVYDLTITGSDNFIVNGFVVHNSGKTRAIMAPIIEMLNEIPDLRVLWGRWDFKDLKLSVMDKFFDVMPQELIENKSEQYHWYDIKQADGKRSRLYFNGLKDLSGLGSQEFGVIAVTEAMEITLNTYRTLKRRCRQAGVPSLLLMESEPPNDDHWLAQVTNPEHEDYDPDITIHHVSTRENWENLPLAYRGSLETMPDAWKDKYLEGHFGFKPDGKPYYSGFRQGTHCGQFDAVTGRQLLCGWDFGFHHPAFLVTQIDSRSRWLWLRALLGTDVTIYKFCDMVTELLNTYYPGIPAIHYGDPACRQVNDKSERTSWDICRSKGFTIINKPSTYRERKEIIERKLATIIEGKPELMVDNRYCKMGVDGFLGGYHYPIRKDSQENSYKFEQPYRDGYYEHLFNAGEYIAVNIFSPVVAAKKVRRIPAHLSGVSGKNGGVRFK